MRKWVVGEDLFMRSLPRGARRGSTWFGRLGDVVQQPPVWAGLAAALALGGGERGRRAALRGFPSGHAATDLAFSLGAALELPVLLVPLSGATMAAHWSLVRSRGHYPTDVLAGGTLAVILTLALWKLWPPGGTGQNGGEQAQSSAPAALTPERGGLGGS